MRTADFREARRKRGLNRAQFAALLGYKGNANTMRKTIYEFERGKRPIPAHIETRINELDMEGR